MEQIVCAVIDALDPREVRLRVQRKAACQGCQAMDVCHSFSPSNDLVFALPRPAGEMHVGDEVRIALPGSTLLKACTIAFMLPLGFIIAALALSVALQATVTVQALAALAAFGTSLPLIRRLGANIKRPRIIEIIPAEEPHEE